MDNTFMEHKYKEVPPLQTIERIQSILKGIGMEPTERLRDSGVGDCFSAHVHLPDGYPLFANGKGVTKDLALASAYAEFIERLQCGLFFYKLQAFNRNEICDLQTFAPDKKYMTLQELEETGDWMDWLIQTYGNGLTRKKLANLCKIYACTEDDRILTVPYYSLFEDKYVYMPAGFVEHIYASNGCCAGNSREEAWVHALSEIMERHCGIEMTLSGRSYPNITELVKEKIPLARHFYDKVLSVGKYDVQQFDISIETGFPVVATRIINKQTHKYIVNFASDPVFEIAVSRGLTEIMQGRMLENISSIHDGTILADITEAAPIHNLLNQVETGNGTFTADFFAEELTCDRAAREYVDNTEKTNAQLLEHCLAIFRKLGHPVYVRNYSFLGFDTYHFVVPGFSEFKWVYFAERIPEYAIGNEVSTFMMDPAAASQDDLSMMLAYYKKTKALFSRQNNFSYLSGLPITNTEPSAVLWVTLAYAAYRTGNMREAIGYTALAAKVNSAEGPYFNCVHQYLTLTQKNIPAQKLRLILSKFNYCGDVDKLYDALENGLTPYDAYLPKCDKVHCETCYYRDLCSLRRLNEYLEPVGKIYEAFTDGQDRSVFGV